MRCLTMSRSAWTAASAGVRSGGLTVDLRGRDVDERPRRLRGVAAERSTSLPLRVVRVRRSSPAGSGCCAGGVGAPGGSGGSTSMASGWVRVEGAGIRMVRRAGLEGAGAEGAAGGTADAGAAGTAGVVDGGAGGAGGRAGSAGGAAPVVVGGAGCAMGGEAGTVVGGMPGG